MRERLHYDKINNMNKKVIFSAIAFLALVGLLVIFGGDYLTKTKTFVISIDDCKFSANKPLQAMKNQTVSLKIKSAESGRLDGHGPFEFFKELTANNQETLTFQAKQAGHFEFEFHPADELKEECQDIGELIIAEEDGDKD